MNVMRLYGRMKGKSTTHESAVCRRRAAALYIYIYIYIY